MASLPVSHSAVNLYADEWDARTVGQFAVYALRSTGGVASLVGDIQARADVPVIKGERAVNRRHWIIEDAHGEVLAEAPSLYKAIHSIAR